MNKHLLLRMGACVRPNLLSEIFASGGSIGRNTPCDTGSTRQFDPTNIAVYNALEQRVAPESVPSYARKTWQKNVMHMIQFLTSFGAPSVPGRTIITPPRKWLPNTLAVSTTSSRHRIAKRSTILVVVVLEPDHVAKPKTRESTS